tara:strand:+ start:509 stop:976 length:468 start_codon:yes stop_codon:yes gene_type:complete
MSIKRSRLKLSILAILIFFGIIAISTPWVENHFIKSAKISLNIENHAGESIRLRVEVDRMVPNAGIAFKYTDEDDGSEIFPLHRGTNYYQIPNPINGKSKELTAQIYAVSNGDPSICHNITPTKNILLPDTHMCSRRRYPSLTVSLDKNHKTIDN